MTWSSDPEYGSVIFCISGSHIVIESSDENWTIFSDTFLITRSNGSGCLYLFKLRVEKGQNGWELKRNAGNIKRYTVSNFLFNFLKMVFILFFKKWFLFYFIKDWNAKFVKCNCFCILYSSNWNRSYYISYVVYIKLETCYKYMKKKTSFIFLKQLNIEHFKNVDRASRVVPKTIAFLATKVSFGVFVLDRSRNVIHFSMHFVIDYVASCSIWPKMRFHIFWHFHQTRP